MPERWVLVLASAAVPLRQREICHCRFCAAHGTKITWQETMEQRLNAIG